MPEWLKALTEAFGGGEKDPLRRTASLRDRVQSEQQKQRELEKQNKSGEHRRPGESDEQARRDDGRALEALLGWKLDVHVEGVDITPIKVDGYWFGVQRYVVHAEDPTDDNPYEIRWKLFFYKPCPHCRHLTPTIELGDYAEVLEASRRMTRGEDPSVPKSTSTLAKYLNDTENKLDPYLPRFCPKCRKVIKGCKAE